MRAKAKVHMHSILFYLSVERKKITEAKQMSAAKQLLTTRNGSDLFAGVNEAMQALQNKGKWSKN